METGIDLVLFMPMSGNIFEFASLLEGEVQGLLEEPCSEVLELHLAIV